MDLNEFSTREAKWPDVSPLSPGTERYWILWHSLHIKNGVSYKKFESDEGKSLR